MEAAPVQTPKPTKTRAKSHSGGKKDRKSRSRSSKAGLQFPVGRVNRHLRHGKYASRIGAGAPVYLAAVLEYVVAEWLEMAGNAARELHKKRITPRHLTLAVRNDEEFDKLLKRATIDQGGVMPHIHPAVAAPKKRKSGKGDSKADAKEDSAGGALANRQESAE